MKRFLFFFISLLIGSSAFATHNRAGEILFEHVHGLTYKVTVVIFADYNTDAYKSRNTVAVDWGDNTGLDTLTAISAVELTTNVGKRVWEGLHTFPGPFDYYISVTDLNRNGNINNIDNSSQVPFYVETLLRISHFIGDENNSVILLNNPIDEACVGQRFVHNPGAFDPDGDSIAYEMVKSKSFDGLVAPGYTFPPTSGTISVDPITGDFIWDSPTVTGEFNVAILVKEYRNGILISSVLRDMQIKVNDSCDNNPPTISTANQYCVTAGNQLTFDVLAKDQNVNDEVELSATGGPFQVTNSPAVFNKPPASNPITGVFSWSTLCEHRRAALYNVSFKAKDSRVNASAKYKSLTSVKSVNIKIIAPSPKNFTAEAIGTSIKLNWDNSFCNDAIGYKLYRRRDSSNFIPDSCLMGVPPNIGYKLIAELNHYDSTLYIDNDNGNGLVPGQRFCYLVVATFEDGDDSYASKEVCAIVEKATPVITQVSIVQTDAQNGILDLRWSPPDSINSQLFPAPYRYLIYSNSQGTMELIDSTLSLNDTLYQVNNLNTLEQQHSYRVDIYSLGNGRQFMGKSTIASSVLLNLTPSDNQMELNWQFSTPWNNYGYVVYRKNYNSTTFDSIGTTTAPFFNDTNLINEKEYCYYIKSIGELQLEAVPNPIINLSQKSCEIPIDQTPPCVPLLGLNAMCDLGYIDLQWNRQSSCKENDEQFFNIYKSTSFEGELQLIEQVSNSTFSIRLDTNDFKSIVGCYAVTALDSNGNESAFSDTICLDNCPTYKLPNVFTPNGDGINDLFIPFPYLYVDSIDLSIFNRWGQVVFKTTNPDINWDGVHYEEKKMVSAGTYFYVCTVYEYTLYGVKPRILKGTINIIDPKLSTSPKN